MQDVHSKTWERSAMNVSVYYYLDLPPEGWARAVLLWNTGSDTITIAKALNRHESVIYNRLPHYREKYKGASVKENAT
jgi:hypothetical protein